MIDAPARRSHESLWQGLTQIFAPLALALLAAGIALDVVRKHYEFWSSGPMIGAYSAGALGLICFFGAVREWTFPLAGDRPHRHRVISPIDSDKPVSQPTTVEEARRMMFEPVSQAGKLMKDPEFPSFMRDSPGDLENCRRNLLKIEIATRYRFHNGGEQNREIDELAQDLIPAMRVLVRECRKVLDPPLWRRIRGMSLRADNLPEPLRSHRQECVTLVEELMPRLTDPQDGKFEIGI